MELSDSHKISQEKRDFKMSDVLITAWSRVQVLPGPPQNSLDVRLGSFCLHLLSKFGYFIMKTLEKARASMLIFI